MVKQFSIEEKIALILEAKKGRNISDICKEIGISRAVFYLWQQAYDTSVQKTKEAILNIEHRRSKDQWWDNKELERAILEIALEHPSYSPQQIIELLEPVWQEKGYSSFLDLSSEQKMEMMRLYESGMGITDICRKYGISRMTFYKWLKRYETSDKNPSSLENQPIPSGEKHYRYVHEAPGLILSIVAKHPEYSSAAISSELEKLTGRQLLAPSSVSRILQSMGLNTYEQRVKYARAQRFVAPDVTPQEVKAQQVHTLSLAKQLFIAFFASFTFFFLGSLILDTMLQAHSVITRIGLFFSFTALFCGIIFFIYSLKYYITIAIILSSTREDAQDSAKGSLLTFFGKIFGFSVEVEEQKQFKPNRLNYDVSHISLEREPFVSIQVGTYNEKRVIDRFLLAATSMEYENYEVIVADDSTDETIQLLEQWKAHPRVKVSHRTTRSGYKGAALAEALKHVDPRTEFLLIFDADFIPYPDTITQFLKYFQYNLGSLNNDTIRQSNVAAIQGYQWHVLNKSENWITRGIRSEYSGSYVIERSGIQVTRGLEQISGSVYMIRLDALQQIGWGTSLTEDFELTLKLYEKGFKVTYTPYIQTPAEAASTIKRLIRQRMRWAEGHSFNVKKMFTKLISSPRLSYSEKFEFLFLAPYYLQAALLLLGTFCWFTAEVIFRTRLPFWTEVWGWSLVLTNLFSIPLMNLIGLFVEESEENDYLGLFSFVILSYIVAPFQAFAAVKGFLEKEEGPWFRTPKTGRITDNFVPGRFYRFVRGIFGQSNSSSQYQSVVSRFVSLNGTHSAFSPFHPSFASVKSVPAFQNRYKWTGKTILSFFLVLALFVNYLTFFAPQKAEAAWYSSGYLRKKAITIDHTKVGRVDVDTANKSSSNGGTAITSLSWSHTTGSQSNRLLIVGVALQNETDSVSTVTFNGTTSLAKVPNAQISCSAACRTELWYVVNPPASTTANIVVSITGSATSIVAGAVTLYNADQTIPFGTAATLADTGTTATSFSINLPTAANQLLVEAVAGGGAGSLGWQPNSGQTALWSNNANNNGTGAYSQASTGNSTTLAWTDASTDNWADAVVPVNPAAQSSFPMLFSRTDTDFKTVANSGLVQNTSSRGNGVTVPDDLVFVDSTETTKLDHEIEKYVATTGEIEAWIRIPTLSGTTDTVIYVYFDNSSVNTSQENVTGVWDSNYLGVWHMGDNAASTSVSDSTSVANNGTNAANTSTKTATGQIDGGLTYNGTSDKTTTNTSGSIKGQAQVTISSWVNTNALNSTQREIYMESTNGTSSTTRMALVIYGGGDTVCNGNQFCFFGRTADGDAKTTFVKSTTALSTGTWYYVVAVYDSTNSINHLMINGVDQTTARTQAAFSSTTPTAVPYIGAQADSSQWFSGTIDETRVSKTARSVGWSVTEYNNQNSPSTFYNVSNISTNTTSPSIEQQINIIDTKFTAAGTTDGIALIDTAHYSGTVSYFFEVDASTTSGTGTVTLTYNAGTGAVPSGGSTVVISGITTTQGLFRSSSFSPTGAQNAYISAISGTGTNVFSARIIITQTNSTFLTDTVSSFDMGSNESTTSTSYTVLTHPKYWRWDSSKYDGTVSVFLDVAAKGNSSGNTLSAALYPAGTSCNNQVSSSAVTTDTTATNERNRSSDFSANLISGTIYMLCFSANTSGSLRSANIVVQQNNNSGITKTEIQHMYVDNNITTTSTSYASQTRQNTFTASNWAGGAFSYYYEATMKTSAGTAFTQLFNSTDATAVTSSEVTTTSTNNTYLQTNGLVMPTTTKTMDIQAKNSSSSNTTTVQGSGLLIDVNSLSTPEHIWFLFPLLFFLPKLIQKIQKNKKFKDSVLFKIFLVLPHFLRVGIIRMSDWILQTYYLFSIFR